MSAKAIKIYILINLFANTFIFIFVLNHMGPHFLDTAFKYHLFILVNQFILFIISNLYLMIILKKIKEQSLAPLKKYEVSEELKEFILSSNPSGYTIINPKGIIEYVNPDITLMLGSTDTLGKNLLDFETVKEAKIDQYIIKAINGTSSVIKDVVYTSYDYIYKKILNFYIYPVFSKSKKIEKVVIIFNDVTREFNLKKEIEANYASNMEVLAEIIDAKDSYTGEHSSNVLKYTSLICDCLELSREERREVEIAASIHDIGKVGIEDSILKKPDKLTFDEYEIMKKHPTIGACITEKAYGFQNISDIVKYHHERWDGKGYPLGLKGEEIPLGAQIIAIADTFDAIVSNRVYRKSLGFERAISILIEEKEKQFNGDLIDIFVSAITKKEE